MKKPNLKLADADLVSSMEKRLANLEGLSKAQRAEIKRKTDQIDTLQSEVEKLRKEVPQDKIEKYRVAARENEKIRKENEEIKGFLAEYGLKWMGKEGKFNIQELQNVLSIKGPTYRNNLPKEIDLVVIIKRIEALNAAVDSQTKTSVSKEGAHVLSV